jgi:hypothetical protein
VKQAELIRRLADFKVEQPLKDVKNRTVVVDLKFKENAFNTDLVIEFAFGPDSLKLMQGSRGKCYIYYVAGTHTSASSVKDRLFFWRTVVEFFKDFLDPEDILA